jgi:hypothetical protein
MTEFVQQVIANSLSGFVGGAVSTVGSYAGSGVAAVGNLIDERGQAVGDGKQPTSCHMAQELTAGRNREEIRRLGVLCRRIWKLGTIRNRRQPFKFPILGRSRREIETRSKVYCIQRHKEGPTGVKAKASPPSTVGGKERNVCVLGRAVQDGRRQPVHGSIHGSFHRANGQVDQTGATQGQVGPVGPVGGQARPTLRQNWRRADGVVQGQERWRQGRAAAEEPAGGQGAGFVVAAQGQGSCR